MTEKTLTTENIKPALDALRGELAPWPVVAKKQDRLNAAQLNAANSGITSSLVAQIIANTAAIRALESAITGTGLRALVVATLPAVGTTGILYIVPVTTYDPDTDADVVNYSNEYIWIPVEAGQASEGHYEQVGQTGIVINNGQLTITVNGTSVGTFTANQSGDTTAAITVPTNADYVDRTTDQTVAGVKTFSSTINGTASKAIADEDGNNIKSSYGKLANVNTWTPAQVFLNALRFNNTSYVIGTPSENIFYTTLQWGGYANNTWSAPFTINNAIRTNGYSDTSFRTYSQTSNTLTGFVHETNADASDISFRPIVNGTHKLGSSSYQWSSVYAQTYYYNGTQWGLDKANVWSGYNTFTNYIALQESAVIPAGGYGKGIAFRDYQNNRLGYIQPHLTPDSEKRLLIGVDSGDIALNSNLIPNANNSVNLGTSTNQWKSVYSQTYYYNGTQWGLDRDNTWTGGNIFLAGSYNNHTVLANATLDLSNGNPALSETNQGMILFTDKDKWLGKIYARLQSWTTTDQTVTVLGATYRPDANTENDFSVWLSNTSNLKSFHPYGVSEPHLGNATYKWKTLNGINPGALSLPDNSNAINLDTTNWGVSGELNHYVPTINGWLCVSVKGGANNGLFLMDTVSGFGQSCYGNANETVAGRIKVALPVIASRDVLIIIHADSNSDIYEAKLYPCLGNV